MTGAVAEESDWPRGHTDFWSGRVNSAELSLCRTVMTKQSAIVETSQGLFKEWVTTETPGRLPQGHVVLLGQLSGRPVGLVCVRVHLCFAGRLIKGRRWLADFNIFSTI